MKKQISRWRRGVFGLRLVLAAASPMVFAAPAHAAEPAKAATVHMTERADWGKLFDAEG